MDNSFLMKVIGIIVAVIVTATVLVPICDSLAEDDGSGGGGGEGATVDLFDLQDAYGDDFPFKTYKVYGTDIEGTTPFNVTTSDIVGVLGALRERNSPYIPEFGIMFADESNGLELLGNLRYNMYTEGGDEYVLSISNMYPNSDGPYVHFADAESQSYDADAVFSLTVSANGSYTLDMGDGSGTDFHLSGSAVAFMAWISDVENGYMPEYIGDGEDGPINGPQISAGLKVVPVTVLHTDTDAIGPLTPMHTITEEEVTARTVTVDGTYNGSGITSYSASIPLVEYGGVLVMDSHSSTVSVEPSSAGLEGDIWMAWLTASSGGGGGSSTDMGTAGTIIKVIPIFVILAILMGSMVLFYNGFYRGEAFTKN